MTGVCVAAANRAHHPFAASPASMASVATSAIPMIVKLGTGTRPNTHAPRHAKAISEGATAASHNHGPVRFPGCAESPHHTPPMKLRISAA